MVGDGGFLFCMEKRGYVKAGPWTPEVTVEHPEAGRKPKLLFLISFFKENNRNNKTIESLFFRGLQLTHKKKHRSFSKNTAKLLVNQEINVFWP